MQLETSFLGMKGNIFKNNLEQRTIRKVHFREKKENLPLKQEI